MFACWRGLRNTTETSLRIWSKLGPPLKPFSNVFSWKALLQSPLVLTCLLILLALDQIAPEPSSCKVLFFKKILFYLYPSQPKTFIFFSLFSFMYVIILEDKGIRRLNSSPLYPSFLLFSENFLFSSPSSFFNDGFIFYELVMGLLKGNSKLLGSLIM